VYELPSAPQIRVQHHQIVWNSHLARLFSSIFMHFPKFVQSVRIERFWLNGSLNLKRTWTESFLISFRTCVQNFMLLSQNARFLWDWTCTTATTSHTSSPADPASLSASPPHPYSHHDWPRASSAELWRKGPADQETHFDSSLRPGRPRDFTKWVFYCLPVPLK